MPSIRRAPAVLCALSLICLAAPAQAAAPAVLGVQGALLNAGGGPVVDGKYALTFALHDAAEGGKTLWTEVHTGILVTAGRFGALVGEKDIDKPLPVAAFATSEALWMGVQVYDEPELPRVRLVATPFAVEAVHAASADTLSKPIGAGQIAAGAIGTDHIAVGAVTAEKLANGAIVAEKVAFTYAGSSDKDGPATSALDLKCSGCVSVGEMDFDTDVDIGGNALKAKKIVTDELTAAVIAADQITAGTVSAVFEGDGSAITGIKLPKGDCAPGTVLLGIDGDGKLKCGPPLAQGGLPADGLNEISNDLLWNQFTDTVGTAQKGASIHDKSAANISTIEFPNLGVAQKLAISVDLENSDLSQLNLIVTDPDSKSYVLCKPCGEPGQKKLVTSFPVPTPLNEGDLTAWIGKNPVGTWVLEVQDTEFCVVQENPGLCKAVVPPIDGVLNDWTITIETLSNKKVEVKGDLIVTGTITGPGGMVIKGNMTFDGTAVIKSAEPVKLDVASGPPLDVGSNTKKVANLNADLLDGIDSAGLSGGMTYTHWGKQQCGSGWSSVSNGNAGLIVERNNWGRANGVICIEGGLANDAGAGVAWSWKHNCSHSQNSGMPCGVCAPNLGPGRPAGQCFTKWGAASCPSGWTNMYNGWITSAVEWQTWGALGETVCMDKAALTNCNASGGTGIAWRGSGTDNFESPRDCVVCCR